jgi:hypothetical protein
MGACTLPPRSTALTIRSVLSWMVLCIGSDIGSILTGEDFRYSAPQSSAGVAGDG